ncbi:MAG: hypothetical protein SWX82_23455 [Cyanobacteriota bacterium]|nr:hypothetical protein [Cyanobacteriota bacterium]
MSENNDRNPLDDIEFTPDLIRGVKKDSSESHNYSGNSEQVEIEEESEEVNEVLQVEVTHDRELFQDISLLRERLEQFSQDVENNYSHLQQEVSRLSNFIWELQEERLNGDVDLESFFGRVKSLENSLESLPGQIEERINSTFGSQQEVNEKFQQFVAGTKQEIQDIVRMVVDFESKQVDAHKLSQEISLLREKLEEFSHLESNSLELEEKVAELSSQILELQEERSNIGVGLEPLFRRVKSLENSLQNLLSGQMEERINNIVNSQQQVNENFNQFAEDTKLEIQIIIQKLVDIESKQVDVQELSQEVSFLRQNLERFSNVESNSLELEEKITELWSQILHLQKERSNIGVGLEPLFRRVKSLENYLQNMEVKYFQFQQKVQNNLNLSQERKEFFYMSIWSLGLAIITYVLNLSIDNSNIFLILLCLILVSPFLLTSLVIFLWSYFSIVLMFGQLFYSSSNVVLSKVDYWLSRYRFILFRLMSEKVRQQSHKSEFFTEYGLLFFILICTLPFSIQGFNLLFKCSGNQEGWILCFLNAGYKQSELMFMIILFVPSIIVSWFVIYWLILQFIKVLALLKQKFIEMLK